MGWQEEQIRLHNISAHLHLNRSTRWEAWLNADGCKITHSSRYQTYP